MQQRRGFLASIAAGFLAAVPSYGKLPLGHPAEPDEAWLKGLHGRHRQFFDVGVIQDGKPLRRVHQFLDSYAKSYALKESDINAIFGAHAAGVVFTLDDNAWSKYDLGAHYSVQDPDTGRPATRNIFVDIKPGGPIPTTASISRLRDRGVVFLACNNSLTTLSEQLAKATSGNARMIEQELVAAILPRMTLVPAMLIAGNRAQEEGLTYAAL